MQTSHHLPICQLSARVSSRQPNRVTKRRKTVKPTSKKYYCIKTAYLNNILLSATFVLTYIHIHSIHNFLTLYSLFKFSYGSGRNLTCYYNRLYIPSRTSLSKTLYTLLEILQQQNKMPVFLRLSLSLFLISYSLYLLSVISFHPTSMISLSSS